MSGPNGVTSDSANGAIKKNEQKLSKNARRRQKRKDEKLQKPNEAEQGQDSLPKDDGKPTSTKVTEMSDAPTSVEAAQDFDVTFSEPSEDNPLWQQYKAMAARNGLLPTTEEEDLSNKKGDIFYEDEDDGIQSEDEEETTKRTISRKKAKEAARLGIAELKSIVKKPELVEWTDPYSSDAIMLLDIKASKNVVPVPSHWSLKREYLSSKRGIEKPPFQLPKYIADTGIGEMREALLEKQNEQTLKQKQRERVAPKMGRMDIDYSKLYDAFFRHQTKPELTRYGEVYYEGKEFETNLKHLKPGDLSEELRAALGMPPGAPPPWLINQQRLGPPPSYPALKIAGLNAPLPVGASWGFHPGGYGKPPTDEANRPLYGGDIFGPAEQQRHRPNAAELGEPVERQMWGEIEEQEPEEEEEDEEEEEEDAENEDEDMDGAQDENVKQEGISTNATTFAPGVESVSGDFSLRKNRGGTDTEEPGYRGPAGRVIRESAAQSSGFFGSDRQYDLSSANNAGMPMLGQEDKSRKRKAGDVDASVDVDELTNGGKLGQDELRARYEAGKRAEQPAGWAQNEQDISDLIAEETRKRQKKDNERRERRGR